MPLAHFGKERKLLHCTVFLQVIPVFAGGLDFSSPVKRFFVDPLGSGKTFVDCVVSLTGFALVGGPARQVRHSGCEGQVRLDLCGLQTCGKPSMAGETQCPSCETFSRVGTFKV